MLYLVYIILVIMARAKILVINLSSIINNLIVNKLALFG